MFYYDYIKMTHIPNEIVNRIIMLARPKPRYVYHLTTICKIVAFKTGKGVGNCRLIDLMANVRNRKRLDKLKTRNHNLVLYQLKRLIISYNDFKETTGITDMCLGEWYKIIIEDTRYTSGDENYESDESYSSDEDDNNDY